MSVWHTSCTCSMGMKEDYMAAVDNVTPVFGAGWLKGWLTPGTLAPQRRSTYNPCGGWIFS